MNKSSQKVLVTGVAGFLGSHLAEKLADAGHEVFGVDNMTGVYKDNVPKNIKFFKFDCCDLKNMNNVMNELLFATVLCLLAHRMTDSLVAIPFLWFIVGLSLGLTKLTFNSHQR